VSDPIESLTCEACGKETPLVDAWATLAGQRIVHTCAAKECLEKAKTSTWLPLPEARTR
jgi:hypothetical protein